MYGEKDTIVCNEAIKNFYKKAGSQCKSIFMLKDAYHELQQEPNKEEVLRSVYEFLSQRISERPRVFGGLDPTKIRTGRLPIPRKQVYMKQICLLFIVALYLLIGFL